MPYICFEFFCSNSKPNLITPWLPCGHCKYKWSIEYQNAVRDEETDVAEKLISLEHKTEFRFLIFPDDANRWEIQLKGGCSLCSGPRCCSFFNIKSKTDMMQWGNCSVAEGEILFNVMCKTRISIKCNAGHCWVLSWGEWWCLATCPSLTIAVVRWARKAARSGINQNKTRFITIKFAPFHLPLVILT